MLPTEKFASISAGPRRKPFVNFRRPLDHQDDSGGPAKVGSLCCQLLLTSLALALMATSLWVQDIVCLSSSPLDLLNSNGSELNLEFRDLSAVPVAQLCSMMAEQVDQINVVSLANNRIRQIEAGSFQCTVASPVLRILILRNNEIERIAGAAFNGLESLQVLLLDNNRLTAIPSNEIFRPMRSLRHLNLANNRIESMDDEAFVRDNANLISLNLNGNPLHRIASNSLLHLIKLKTLTLSQSALSGHLTVLNGLPELRYYHLDRAANLRTVPTNLCQSSRKISSLVLKSNQLEQVPQFQHCQSLLLLDLSYNRIQGSLSENFTLQLNLIDLYLGHNRIETIEEGAFMGLNRLQVLELDHNNLKQIHPRAFLLIRASIHELNLSNNHQLSALSGLGLDQLASFKGFGNRQLRRLPRFKSVSSLVLTYAYHCCDYQPMEGVHQPEGQIAVEGSLVAQLFSSALKNIWLLLPGTNHQPSSFDGEESIRSLQSRDNDTSNLAEIILWPKAPRLTNNAMKLANSQHHTLEPQIHKRNSFHSDFDPWQTKVIGDDEEKSSREPLEILAEGNLSRPEADVGNLRRQAANNNNNNHHYYYHSVHLIDELLEEAEQIRLDHSVELVNQIWRRPRMDKSLASSVQTRQAGREHNIIKFWFKHGERDDDATSEAHRDDEEPSGRHRNNFSGDKVAKILSKMLIHPINQDVRHPVRRESSQQASSSSSSSSSVVQCLPKPSPFFPCQDLFDTWWLRAGVWSVFLLAFTGNILVIIVLSSVRQSSSTLTNIMWLTHSKRHIDVPRFLVINLAIADLMMALYLGILAFVDLSTLGEFKMFAIKWQYSSGCKLASFLGILSSELSIFILAIITLERNYAITNAVHLNRRLSLHKAMVIMFIGYAFAFLMAIMPLNGISDYRKFSICLPLDMDSNLYSHIYVMALICINAFSFILLLSCYLRMYCAIRGSQAWNTNDLRIAKRMSILVITDFICWMPIIVVGIGSLFGHHLIGSNGIKIMTIFILPLNSVANPFLYAITTKKFKRDLNTLLHRLRRLISCIPCSSDTNMKDPNAFTGYNNYHRNMMTMMDKNKRPYAKGGGGANQSSYGRHQTHRGDGRRQLTRTAAAQTAEQLTVNRTTCSCRRIEIQQTTSDGELVQRAQHFYLKPPRLINQASDRPATEDQINQQSNCYLDETLGCQATNLPSVSMQQATGSSQDHAMRLPKTLITDSQTDLRPGFSSEVIVCTNGEPMRDCASNSRLLVSSVTSPGQLNGHHLPAANCSTALTEGEPQRHLLSVSIQQTDRSASACGFSATSKVNTSGDHPEARAIGSCDTMRVTSNRNSLERLSRSISKILFHPIAKAWSSMQISLNSSVGQLGNANVNRRRTNVLSEERSSSAKKSIDSDQQFQDSTTIDDLLMASGSQPSGRQLLRNSERRMSRSCDYIKSQSSPTSIIMMSPTSSGHEPTTSQGDYDDDERILLATIGRMTVNKCGNRAPIIPQTHDRPSLTNSQNARNRCTRCRSWSPALLGKLEDCIYQIKCRIPGLNVKEGCHLDQPEEGKPSNIRYPDDHCVIERDNDESMIGQLNHGSKGIGEISLIGQHDSDGDRFGGENCARGSIVDPRSDRPQQRSSGNSDTLSTRTGGTIVTNMSASFDSNTKIPNQVVHQHREND